MVASEGQTLRSTWHCAKQREVNGKFKKKRIYIITAWTSARFVFCFLREFCLFSFVYLMYFLCHVKQSADWRKHEIDRPSHSVSNCKEFLHAFFFLCFPDGENTNREVFFLFFLKTRNGKIISLFLNWRIVILYYWSVSRS